MITVLGEDDDDEQALENEEWRQQGKKLPVLEENEYQADALPEDLHAADCLWQESLQRNIEPRAPIHLPLPKDYDPPTEPWISVLVHKKSCKLIIDPFFESKQAIVLECAEL